MPIFRRRRADAIKESPNRAIVAAATRMVGPGADAYNKTRIRRESWATEAWRQYDLSGELRYAVEWMANSLSRIRLTVNEVDEKGRILGETTNQAVLDALYGLIGEPGCAAEYLYSFGLNLGVAGDCYLIGWEGPSGNFEKFMIVSTEEITDSTQGFTIDMGDGDLVEVDPNRELVYRIHQPHPRKRKEANSSVRGALPVLREMEELKKYQTTVIYSRIGGAGILCMPSEMTLPNAPEDLQPGESPFMATLADGILTPIGDPGDPSAYVPVVVQAPGETLGQIQWLRAPGTELTTVTGELFKDATNRLALALDIPKEVLMGGGDASRWHSWQIEESAIKIHVEPKMILICAALTKAILRATLEALDINSDSMVFWFDSVELIQRPDRSANALTMHERGLISDAAMLEEAGFEPDDAPVGEEICRNLAKEIIRLAPRFAEDHLDVAVKLLGLDACGINPDDVKPAPNPDGGTPREGDAPPPAEESRPKPPAAKE